MDFDNVSSGDFWIPTIGLTIFFLEYKYTVQVILIGVFGITRGQEPLMRELFALPGTTRIVVKTCYLINEN